MTQEKSGFHGKIEAIQCLRAVAFAGIFIYHVGFFSGTGLHLEAYVNLFFVLSGFFAMYATQKPTKGYLIKRMVRIIPLYWLMTVVTFAASVFGIISFQGDVGLSELFKSLFLLPYHRPTMKGVNLAVRPLVGPGWTLYYEALFAVIFAISMRISHKHRGWIAGSVCQLLVLAGEFVPTESAIMSIVFDSALRWACFLAGILSFEANRLLWPHTEKIARRAEVRVLAVIFIAIGMFVLAKNGISQPISGLVCALMLTCTIQLLGRAKCPKALVHVGNVSYSCYLLNYYVIVAIGFIVDWKKLNAMTMIMTVVAFLVTVGASTISRYVIENRFGNFLKEKLLRG